ncbi:MAG: shikimate dehydrogenase [Zavarzinella sp.]
MSPELARVCVVIARTRHKMVQVELDEAYKAGARFIEVRLDYFSKAVDFKRLFEKKQCPWVFTLRKVKDGGRFAGSEEQRQALLRSAIVSGVDWIDLETEIADEIRRFRDVKRIVSYHNFQETPANLEEIYEKMLKQDADVLKIVTMANHPNDSLRILKLIKEQKKPTVGHCMGEYGLPSRMIALVCGAPFMYCAFNSERNIAPGLLSLAELKQIYQINGVNQDTKIFGLLGDPVSHSFSPILHNSMFRKHKFNGLYVPFRVGRGQLAEMIPAYQELPVDGYSVTIPHKNAAMAFAKSLDEHSQETNALNTLVRTADGFSGCNTDYDAAMACLKQAAPKDENGATIELGNSSAIILGAGGAARAIAYGLRRAGINQIYITSRTYSNSQQLANEVQGKAVEWHLRHSFACDVVINCTPVGMHPNLDESPVHSSYLKPGMVVFDTIYNPENTLLIKDARNRGCQIITGVEMFVRQAAMQFQKFTNIDVPLDDMRECFRRALSPLRHTDEEAE